MRKWLWLLLALTALVGLALACGDTDDDEDEDCPSFAEYPQVYPEAGDADSHHELYVRFKSKKVNRQLERVYAQLYYTNGQYAGVTFDMVRTEDDDYRYLRSFTGSEVCEEDFCFLRFRVFAEHADGCTKSLESNIFQVIIEEGDDDTE